MLTEAGLRRRRDRTVLELRYSLTKTDVDRAVLARTIVEVITTWAVKMPWTELHVRTPTTPPPPARR